MKIGDLSQSAAEQGRVTNMLQLLLIGQQTILDVGARDGYISKILAAYCTQLTALDLQLPRITHPNITCVQGDVTRLEFPDAAFDTVVCLEVLEHIADLGRACAELSRVARHCVIIGVPFRQELRSGRTTCSACGQINPPWGHLNWCDENRVDSLFPTLRRDCLSYVGSTNDATNAFSTWLLDAAGNPYGTYDQQEPCIHCGARLIAPPRRGLHQRVFTRIAVRVNDMQRRFLARPHPTWIHVRFSRREDLGENWKHVA